MRRTSMVVVGTLVCAVLFISLRGFGQGVSKSPAAVQPADQIGEGVLVLQIVRTTGIEAKSETQVMDGARLIKMGERYFVRGKGYVAKSLENDRKYNWHRGVDVAYAWDSIASFQLMTPDVFEKYLAAFDLND